MKIGSNIIATEKELKSLGISLDKLTQDLTLPNPEYENTMRFRKGRFFKPVNKYNCYLKETSKGSGEYIVPRYYNGEPQNMSESLKGRTTYFNINIKLRDYQQSFIDENRTRFTEYSGVLLEAGCGAGKTTISLYIAWMRGVQTLVIVPTNYLAGQWKQRINEFTDASVYVMTANDKEIPTDSDFTIITTDLFNCRVFPPELVKNIGHVILDEAHRMGAETYIPILDEIPAYYRTALTATFRRADGVHKVLKYHFGEHLKMESRFPRPSVYAIKTGIRVENILSKKNIDLEPLKEFLDGCNAWYDVKYHETPSEFTFVGKQQQLLKRADDLLYKGRINKTTHKFLCAKIKKGAELQYPCIDTYLNEHAGRRKMIIRVIQQCLDAGRTVLFLSKRKDTLRAMEKYFKAYDPMLIVSETSKRTEEEENFLQNKCRLVLGVTQLAKEGLDIDRLDTLIIHLPMKDTEQAIGRISRLHPKKQKPLAFYFLDACPMTYAVYNNAKKYLKINAELKGEITMDDVPKVLA